MGLFDNIFGNSMGDIFSVGGLTTGFMKQYGKDQAAYQDPINKNNLKWARRARQTEWTDTVKSMRDANINPALAFSTGAVSSDVAPTNATADNPLLQMLNIGTQAGALGKQRAETKQITEQTELTRQQQETEGTKRALMNAQRINMAADTVLKDKNAHYFDKHMAYNFKKIASETAFNYVNASKLRSDITLNHTIQDLKEAETRYTNEKSRGYVDSGSFSGFGVSGSYSKSGNQGVKKNQTSKKWKFKRIEYYDPKTNKVVREYVKV